MIMVMMIFYLCEKDQQDAHFLLTIYFHSIILNMFGTNNYSSSGGLYNELTVFYHASLWGV